MAAYEHCCSLIGLLYVGSILSMHYTGVQTSYHSHNIARDCIAASFGPTDKHQHFDATDSKEVYDPEVN